MSIKLLCDPVTHNPGDLAIGEVELEFFRKHGLEIEPVGPDFAGRGPFIIGGGEILQPIVNPFHRGFRRRGGHVLCASGIGEGAESLEYLREYRYLSVRTKHDLDLLKAAGGPEADLFPCPANLLEPEPSGLDASGRIGLQCSVASQCDLFSNAANGPVLAFPWRRDLQGLLVHDDTNCAERIALACDGEVVPGGLTARQLMDVISQLDVFICQTLHGAMWAYQSGVQFLVQGYAPKVVNWARERGLIDRVFESPEQIGEMLARIGRPVYPTASVDREEAARGLELVCEAASEMEAHWQPGESEGPEAAESLEPPGDSRPLEKYGLFFLKEEYDRQKLEIEKAREYVRGLEAEIDAKNSEIEKASRHIGKLELIDAERVKQLEAASVRIAELEGRSEEA